ncbi:protein of unassigned function [Methylobacterium oryzae CBMB20]|uniref:Protein of unassigned function n=1 Tax=Methylobacterium oryzae CBMB20 TaxID=693986 RepID=A0A089NXI1_9HYPH|nr:protein of unassigned function [Methylobacterium oryzae CBMB20]
MAAAGQGRRSRREGCPRRITPDWRRGDPWARPRRGAGGSAEPGGGPGGARPVRGPRRSAHAVGTARPCL